MPLRVASGGRVSGATTRVTVRVRVFRRFGLPARGGRLALRFRGVVRRDRRHGGRDLEPGRGTLQTCQFIALLLDLDALGRILGNQRLDEVQQLPHKLARRGVRDGIQVGVRDLHAPSVREMAKTSSHEPRWACVPST